MHYVKDNAVFAHAHPLFNALCEAMPIDNNSKEVTEEITTLPGLSQLCEQDVAGIAIFQKGRDSVASGSLMGPNHDETMWASGCSAKTVTSSFCQCNPQSWRGQLPGMCGVPGTHLWRARRLPAGDLAAMSHICISGGWTVSPPHNHSPAGPHVQTRPGLLKTKVKSM